MGIQKDNVRFSVVLDSREKANGFQKIYIRLFQGGKKREYYTGISWPKEFFDKANERLKSRFPGDPDFDGHNMMIGQYKTMLHQLKVNSFVKNESLTLDHILLSLRSITSEVDFYRFALEESKRLAQNKIIEYSTYKRHRSSLKKLAEYHKSEIIPFHHITLNSIASMDAYYRSKKKSHNTITGYHKDIKGYLNKAIKAGMIDLNPYDEFKFKYVDGEREALTQDELKALMKLFREKKLLHAHQETLRRFLFSCLTGIRISDTHNLKDTDMKDGCVILKPIKGQRFGKLVKIPLSVTAMSLIVGRSGKIFEPSTDQHINRQLKIIAAYAGICKRLTYHSARDTFGTIFIERGGDIKSLSDLMGHSSLQVTMIYLKMSDQRKLQLINNFDSIFE